MPPESSPDDSQVLQSAFGPRISILRVLFLAVPLAVLLVLGTYYFNKNLEQDARLQSQHQSLGQLGLTSPTKNRLDSRFVDEDGDLVADPPQQPEELLDPESLTFTYIPEQTPQQILWQPLMDAIARETGKQVEYLPLTTQDEQLQALKSGKLHITGINTGNVPLAVNAGGFVPFCTLGKEDKSFGYKMLIIVPAKSSIKTVSDLAGQKLTFTDRLSNSGYKAPVVLLMSDFGLLPERDYRWGFSYSHDESIRGIAAGDYQAAAIASELLDRALAAGVVREEDIRIIYESEVFPPATLGHRYDLPPKLAAKIRHAVLEFSWTETPLMTEFSPNGIVQFVNISYKDDFAVIRRIDDVLGRVHQLP